MTESCLTFFVPGLPATAGSKRVLPIRKKVDGQMQATGRFIVADMSGEKGKAWRQDVKAAAWDVMRATGRALLNEPLIVRIEFVMPRIGSHFGSGRNASALKPNAPAVHSVQPDLLKLTRAIEDALTNLVYTDDALICEEHLYKRYGEHPGARVTIKTWASEQVIREGIFPTDILSLQ